MTRNCEFGDTLVINGNDIIKSDPESPPCEALATKTAHVPIGAFEGVDEHYLDINLCTDHFVLFQKAVARVNLNDYLKEKR